MPSTKWHPRWLCLVSYSDEAWNDTCVGVIACSVSFVCPTTYIEQSWLNNLNSIIILLYIFDSIYLIEYWAHRNFTGILYPWSQDRILAGTGVGQSKMPHRTLVSITIHTPLLYCGYGLDHNNKQEKKNQKTVGRIQI